MAILIIISSILLGAIIYLGSIQLIRLFKSGYQELLSLCEDIKKTIYHRRRGTRIIEIKVTKEQKATSQAVEYPVEMVEQPQVKNPEITELQANEIEYTPSEEDTVCIVLETGSDEYSLSDEVTVDELEQMSRTLSAESAPIAEEIATATTICKLRDTPMMEALISMANKRMKGIFANVEAHGATKITKEGFDYSEYIKT